MSALQPTTLQDPQILKDSQEVTPLPNLQPAYAQLLQDSIEEEDYDVIGEIGVPRYALPNISSLLPAYRNTEQDYIHRTFTTGNFEMLRSLPDHLRPYEVNKSRQAGLEDAWINSATIRANKEAYIQQQQDGALGVTAGRVCTANGLFSDFECWPEFQDEESLLKTVARLKAAQAQLQISETPFYYGGTHGSKPITASKASYYPYLEDAYEGLDDDALRERWMHDAKQMFGAFLPPSNAHLTSTPTKASTLESMQHLRSVILDDWPELNLLIYPNARQFWVLRINKESVESVHGLTAYLNVLLTGNPVVKRYGLVRVVEHWGEEPDDGHVYFVLRPPWVAVQAKEAMFQLHPEHRSYKASVEFRNTTKALKTAEKRHTHRQKQREAAKQDKAKRPIITRDLINLLDKFGNPKDNT